jgi:hypothetical protein
VSDGLAINLANSGPFGNVHRFRLFVAGCMWQADGNGRSRLLSRFSIFFERGQIFFNDDSES